jgi:uncharacterized membrane protein YedE/YeeE
VEGLLVLTDSPEIWFVLGPLLGLIVFVVFMTRNDSYGLEAENKFKSEIKKNRFLHGAELFNELIGNILIPFFIFYLCGVLLGALLLFGLGYFIISRPNFLRGSLMTERVNKATGILYMVVGAIGFIFWAGSKL